MNDPRKVTLSDYDLSVAMLDWANKHRPGVIPPGPCSTRFVVVGGKILAAEIYSVPKPAGEAQDAVA
jgi:hypothetical protein